MITAPHNLAPSNLGQLIGKIKAIASHCGISVPIQVGSSYEVANQGNPPKVTFIPEQSGGRIAPPIAMGKTVATCHHSCRVIVRAKPGQQEEDRYAYAYALMDSIVAIIASAGVGRIEWGTMGDASVTRTNGDGSGVGLQFSFIFKREIPQLDDIWLLPEASPGTEREIRDVLDLSGYVPSGARVPAEELEIDAVINPTVTPEE